MKRKNCCTNEATLREGETLEKDGEEGNNTDRTMKNGS